MNLSRKLDDWRAAGLIDREAALAIAAHEEEGQRPVVLWAVAGIGLFALGLGVLLLVAANWDRISAAFKLAFHLAALAAAGWAAWRGLERETPWLTDGALFSLAVLVLSGFALHAQIFGLTGPLWRPLALSCLLTAPALLFVGRTQLSAYILLALGFAAAIAFQGANAFDGRASLAGDAICAAFVPALLVLSLQPAEHVRRPVAEALLTAGIYLLLLAASLSHLGWAVQIARTDAVEALPRLAPAALLALAAALLALRRHLLAEGRLLAVALVGSTLAALLALALPHGDGPFWRVVGLASFAGLWITVALAALRAGWVGLFNLGIAAIAVRLFIVYVELFYSMAFTGLGLVIGGALLIGLAFGWARVTRWLRPGRSAAA